MKVKPSDAEAERSGLLNKLISKNCVLQNKIARRSACFFLVFCTLLTFVYITLRLIPCRKLLSFENKQNSSRFYDTNGILMYIMPLEEGLRREFYPIEEIPDYLSNAFINAEDKNFYHHHGINFSSIARAVIQNRKAGHVISGASTITMQLVRIIWPRTKKVTVATKTKEAFLALYLEIKYSKKKILELYLNNVPFGQQIEGIGSACRSFFGREPDKISPEQAAELAKIIRRPADSSIKKSYAYPSVCMHFVNYIISSYKKQNKIIPPTLNLSIDSALTIFSQERIQQKLEEFRDARIHNGSVFAINNKTGQIIVWAGNASFDDDIHSGQIDGVLVKNQPGSSMKPFLYALALENGFSPNDVLPDIQQDFGGEGVYVPLNFNNRYNGPVRFRVALASSLNIPAVYLLYKVGIKKYMEQLNRLGYESLKGTEDTTGLSLALGSSEVTLYEMVRAFSVFTNDGELINITWEKDCPQKQKMRKVYNSDTARIMCDILTDESARVLGFGHASVFNTPYPAIFKTGTSNQFQNIIALGATTAYTVGVWMGNFEGETVIGQTGSSIPASIVRSLLDELTRRNPSGTSEFKNPRFYSKTKICGLSGMAPDNDCPSVVEEFVKNGTILPVCNWHNNINGRVKITYPSEYQHWADSKNFLGSSSDGSMLRGASLAITYPRNNAHFIYNPSLPMSVQQLTVTAVGGNGTSAELFLDNKSAGLVKNVFSWKIPLTPGEHELYVVCDGQKTNVSRFVVK